MNMDTDRPYACAAPGCTQRFLTEDHLTVHRHKHQLSLTLSSVRKDSVLPGETPTPTRFLRSCEEVGLFNELDLSPQSEEEPEQGSVEQKQNHEHMSHHSNSSARQQATPSTKASPILTQETTPNQQAGLVSGLLSCMLYLQTQQRQPQPASNPDSAQPGPALPDSAQPGLALPDSAQPGPALPDSVQPSSASVHLSVKGHGLSLGSRLIGSAHSRTGSAPQCLHSEAQQRLKATLRQHHSGSVANNNMNPVGHMMEMTSSQQKQQPLPCAHQHHSHAQPQSHTHNHTHSQSPAHSHTQSQRENNHPQRPLTLPPRTPPNPRSCPGGPSQVCVQGGVGRRGRGREAELDGRGRGREAELDGRRQKFLERNRAAATRCRQKRKVWVCSLERKAEELSHTHLQLQNEVTQLKSEVLQLKQLLLAHSDCPVTARQKEAQGYLSAEPSPAGGPAPAGSRPRPLQHNSISTSTAPGGDRGPALPPSHCH